MDALLIDPSVNAPTANDPGDPDALHLEGALLLLQQSGYPLPDRAHVSGTEWLQHVLNGLCELSSRDPLTALANRRHFETSLSSEVDRVARAGEPALVLLIDIDHFKKVNDTYGHPIGDLVLKAVAKTLADCIRPMDTLARYGGEEFAMILPNCAPTFGQVVAERIRSMVQRTSVTVAPAQRISVSVSIGGAFAPQWVRSSAELWIKRADDQLYLAKSQGRNRSCLEQQTTSLVSPEEKGLLFGTSQFAEFE